MQQELELHDWRNTAGPVAEAYENTDEALAVIEGPTGGGKTQASARRCLRVALKQHPSPRDGFRKARICCVAPTYRLLWDTAVPSFRKVFPDSLGGTFKGSKGDPADYELNAVMRNARGEECKIHLEVQFRALRDESAEDFVRGREVTAWWDPEMDTMPAQDLLSLQSNRVGRYPEPHDRWEPEEAEARGWKPAYRGVFGDTNTPVIGSWFHKAAYTDKIFGAGYFRQPPALRADGSTNPAAENLHNLRRIDPNYYPKMAKDMSDYDIGRLLKLKPGYSRNGKPVHEHFEADRHVATVALPIDPALPVKVGADMGNTLKCAATFSQRSFSGQKRGLREISPIDRQIDIVEFAAEILRVLDVDFPFAMEVVVTVDPSARGKTVQNKEISYAQLFQGLLNPPTSRRRVTVKLAKSNDPGIRRSGVDQLLKRNAGPGEPAMILCPQGMPQLIAGLAGGYRFKKLGNVYQPQPDKNDHSHEAEAWQYDVLGSEGLQGDGGFIPPRPPGGEGGGVIL